MSISHILLILLELYKFPHSCSLSPTFILFDLLLKRQICCWMSYTSVGLAQTACSLWVQTYGKRHSKKLTIGFIKEWGSHTKQDLLWTLSMKWKENCFRRIFCQFCLIPVHIQWGSNACAVSIFSSLGLTFHTEKSSDVDNPVHNREPKNTQSKPL